MARQCISMCIHDARALVAEYLDNRVYATGNTEGEKAAYAEIALYLEPFRASLTDVLDATALGMDAFLDAFGATESVPSAEDVMDSAAPMILEKVRILFTHTHTLSLSRYCAPLCVYARPAYVNFLLYSSRRTMRQHVRP